MSVHPQLFYSGKLLEKNLRRSLVWEKSQRDIATLMSGAFDAATVDKWRKMREEFDSDHSKPNPYEEHDNRTFISSEMPPPPSHQFIDITMAQLKLELLKEEAKELTEGTSAHKVSVGAFLRKAIEIEDRQ